MQKTHGTSKVNGLKNKLQRSSVDPDEKVFSLNVIVARFLLIAPRKAERWHAAAVTSHC